MKTDSKFCLNYTQITFSRHHGKQTITRTFQKARQMRINKSRKFYHPIFRERYTMNMENMKYRAAKNDLLYSKRKQRVNAFIFLFFFQAQRNIY